MTASRSTQALRGSVAASVATIVALFSHVTGGGVMPDPIGIIVPLVFSLMVCVLFGGRRLSWIRLSLSVAVSQFLFHTLFILGVIRTPEAAPSVTPHTLHEIPASIHVSGAISTSPGGHSEAGMWIAHLAAALVTIVALHRGETGLIRLGACTSSALARLLPVTLIVFGVPSPCARARFEQRDLLPLSWGVFPPAVPRRGPPVPSAR